MHCPNCGTETASGQKYCRSCGLNLEKIAELVAEQLPERRAPADLEKGAWQRYAERVGLLILLSGAGIFFLAICWAIIGKIMIGKGQYLEGGIFLAIIIALVVGGSLLGLSNSSAPSEPKSAQPKPDSLADAEPTARLLNEPALEPVPSITEQTTGLLAVDKNSKSS